MTASRRRAAWYWLSQTVPRRPRGLVAVVLLVGLLGGVATGAIVAARRTEAASPDYLRTSHASDLQLVLYHLSGTGGGGIGIAAELAHLGGVAHVATDPYLFVMPTGAHVSPAIADGDVSVVGSEGGAYTRVDQPAIVAGRLAPSSLPP